MAEGVFSLSDRPRVSGNVHLILADNCSLTADKGITVNEGTSEDGEANSLSIYAQSEGEGMGALKVSGTDSDAGIGGARDNSSGLITIHGGKIEAASNGNGAGIGGGSNGSGTITIYGGTVTATASSYGAGIGGGVNGSGKITIRGGTVTATANDEGAGIGNGYNGSGTVTISGGTVSATASGSGAAIGGGKDGTGTVTISGGTVTATAMNYSSGAGIGGGCSHNGQGGSGTVTISGGTVTATASGEGAVIGNGWEGIGGRVAITGGSVSAVHTTQSHLSIGGGRGECTVSLGLTKKNDSVYAAGYRAKDNTVTLTAALQDAGTGKKFLDGDVPAGDVARKLLVPDMEGVAEQYAWKDKAVTFRLPGSLTGIGSGAFQGIRAATMLVPQTVKKIGPDAFRGSGVKRIKFENGNPETFDASAFEGCPFVIVYTPAQGKVYETLKDDPKIYIISK